MSFMRTSVVASARCIPVPSSSSACVGRRSSCFENAKHGDNEFGVVMNTAWRASRSRASSYTRAGEG